MDIPWPVTPVLPPRTQSTRQELQHLRHDRFRRRVRTALVSALIVVVLVAAAGYGGYRLLERGSGDLTREGGGATTSVPGASSTAATGVTATTSGVGSVATSVGAGTSADPTAPTSTTAPTLAAQKLSLQSNPGGASVRIILSDGTAVTGKTPFSQSVPGGQISVKLSLPGYNPVTRSIALTKARSLTLWLDPTGLLFQSAIRFKTGPAPKQVAFSPDGKELWVSDLGGYGVEVFDPATGKRLALVKLGQHGAVEVIFTRDGKTVYASQMETASVYEIDRATRTVKRVLKTGGTWTKVLALSPDEKTLYAANWSSNNVSEIDLTSGKLKRLIKTVTTPRGLYVTPDGKRLFVAGYDKGDIERITLATGASKVLLHTGGAMRHMVGDDVNGLLYADDMLVRPGVCGGSGHGECAQAGEDGQRAQHHRPQPGRQSALRVQPRQEQPQDLLHPRPRMGLSAGHRYRHGQDFGRYRGGQSVHRA